MKSAKFLIFIFPR